jgi:8-oxo-dGTP pyrophosphatase MutT (NUDIX family)
MGKRRDSDKWVFPAGHLEPGEDPAAGAIRELKEETNLDARHVRLVGCVFIKERGVLLYLFHADADGVVDCSGDPDQELSECGWHDPLELMDSLQIPPPHNCALAWFLANS